MGLQSSGTEWLVVSIGRLLALSLFTPKRARSSRVEYAPPVSLFFYLTLAASLCGAGCHLAGEA